MELSQNQKGSLTELQCITAFLALGAEVSIPYGNHARYDFIADIRGQLLKIQVKTAKITDEFLEFECRTHHIQKGKTTHHTYTDNEVDFFATYANGQCYLVPIEHCSSTKKLRFVPTKNNQSIGISWAKDYCLEEVIKNL